MINKIHTSIACAIVMSITVSLTACADEGSESKSKPIQNEMASMETIVNNLESAGFSSVNSIKYENGSYAVNGIANGMFTTAYVEPYSGNVIQEKNFASLKKIDQIKKLVKDLQSKYYHIIYSINLNSDQTEYQVTAKSSNTNKVSLTVSKDGEISSY